MNINRFYQRLFERDYVGSFVIPFFHIVITKAKEQNTNDLDHDKVTNNMESTFFLHLPFNTVDFSYRDIQKTFIKTMLKEKNYCDILPNIKNHSGQSMNIGRLVVEYSKQNNIKNHVFPRKFDSLKSHKISHNLNDKNFESITESKK